MSLTTLDIKEPGLNTLPPGVERYVVEGGGLTGIQILPEDEIEIINNEGNQICEISTFDKDGKPELSILGLKEIKINSKIKEILFKKDESSLQALLQLKKRNLNIDKLKSSLIFDKKTKAGESIKLKSKDKCYCIFAAPGDQMMVHEQNPSTELTIMIKRSVIKKDKDFSIIPDPVYEPSNEINIDKTTASSYQVKEGDYIQVITPNFISKLTCIASS